MDASLYAAIFNYFWERTAMKTPKKIKLVGFVSGAQQCHEHKMKTTTYNFFFVKRN
jgi:hypothetical protein